MAIAYIASSKSGEKTSSPFTWSHNVAAGTDRMLVVSVMVKSAMMGSQPAVSAVTYNGDAMTKALNKQYSGSFYKYETSIWLLHNPDTGNNTVSVTCSNVAYAEGFAADYTGASQTSAADATGSTSGTGSGTKTATATTVADNCWVTAILCCGNSTASASHTLRQGQSGINVLGFFEDTNAATTPAGAVNIGGNVGVMSVDYTISACSFAPAAAAAGNPHYAYAQQ